MSEEHRTETLQTQAALAALEAFAQLLVKSQIGPPQRRSILQIAWDTARLGDALLDEELTVLCTEETALAELGAVAVSAALEAHGAQKAPPNVRPFEWIRWRVDACARAALVAGLEREKCESLRHIGASLLEPYRLEFERQDQQQLLAMQREKAQQLREQEQQAQRSQALEAKHRRIQELQEEPEQPELREAMHLERKELEAQLAASRCAGEENIQDGATQAFLADVHQQGTDVHGKSRGSGSALPEADSEKANGTHQQSTAAHSRARGSESVLPEADSEKAQGTHEQSTAVHSTARGSGSALPQADSEKEQGTHQPSTAVHSRARGSESVLPEADSEKAQGTRQQSTAVHSRARGRGSALPEADSEKARQQSTAAHSRARGSESVLPEADSEKAHGTRQQSTAVHSRTHGSGSALPEADSEKAHQQSTAAHSRARGSESVLPEADSEKVHGTHQQSTAVHSRARGSGSVSVSPEADSENVEGTHQQSEASNTGVSKEVAAETLGNAAREDSASLAEAKRGKEPQATVESTSTPAMQAKSLWVQQLGDASVEASSENWLGPLSAGEVMQMAKDGSLGPDGLVFNGTAPPQDGSGAQPLWQCLPDLGQELRRASEVQLQEELQKRFQKLPRQEDATDILR